jgi:hypothetical protein
VRLLLPQHAVAVGWRATAQITRRQMHLDRVAIGVLESRPRVDSVLFHISGLQHPHLPPAGPATRATTPAMGELPEPSLNSHAQLHMHAKSLPLI